MLHCIINFSCLFSTIDAVELSNCEGIPSMITYHQLYFVQESFLNNFKSLEPELCVTAAYGNILPSKFLKIPSLG